MIELDDNSAWQQLEHAYGDTSDLPKYLKQVYDEPSRQCSWDEEPWHYLWSSLCHQGDIYSASIAAVPHLVKAAAAKPEELFVWDCIGLPIAIETARQGGKIIEVDDQYLKGLEEINLLIKIALSHTKKKIYADVIRDAKKTLSKIGLLKENDPPTEDDLFSSAN